MKLLFRHHTLRYIALGILGLIVLVFAVRAALKDDTEGREQARVERGNVEVLVSVSGTVRTKNMATLGFSGTGVVEEVLVKEGDRVEKGQVLASLIRSSQIAEYNDALATLQSREAALEELIAGPRAEARDVTASEVAIAREDLARVTKEEDQKVENARRTLYSQGLTAIPENPNEDAEAPEISGTYTCEEPVTYSFVTYPSAADSRYSFRITGGGDVQTSSAVTHSAIPFGTCGLYIQFAEDTAYGNSSWIIEIPNTRSGAYTTNKSAYELAMHDRDNAVAAARQALEKAEKEAGLANAAPRSEELERAEADVD
jgi:multidrug efflux pump subunit AcrA (membrane-fusion protein)